MKPRPLFSLLLILILALAAGAGAWFYYELHHPLRHTQRDYLEIARGSSPDQIINHLTDAGVIGRAWPLRLYLRVTGAGARLKAGQYRFASPISPLQVLRKLEEGQQRLSRFTVVEGWTRWNIAAEMAEIPELKLADASAALSLMNDTSAIKDLDPEADNLEGYLYPDTYNFPPQTDAREMIKQMVQRFRQVWKEKLREAAPQPPRTMREIVTIASLIETEAKLAEERPLVASVIYNRLQRQIPLGIDSTVIYASKLAGKWKNDGKVYQSDLDRVSPYNTRQVRGLPPGPVASPGARSLEAALTPATTDYLYYVREPTRNDGAHNFYQHESDFQRGVQALREWERTRPARTASTPASDNGK